MNQNTLKKSAATCRWTARVIGSLLVLTIVLIAVGEGIPNLLTQPVGVQIGFLALGLIVAGIVAGWRWELTGGLLSLFGWALFVVTFHSPRVFNPFVVCLTLPGGLYVASALLRRFSRTKHEVPV